MERKLTAIATSTATTTTTKWWQQRQRKQNNIYLCEGMAIREGKMLEIRMEWDWREKFVELYQNVDLHAYVSYRSVYSMSDLGIRTHTHTSTRTHRNLRGKRSTQRKGERARERYRQKKLNEHTNELSTHAHILKRSLMSVRTYVCSWAVAVDSIILYGLVCTMLTLNWFYFIFVSWRKREDQQRK